MWVQEKNGNMDGNLARDTIHVVPKMLLAGVHQPPVRERAIRVTHCYGHVDGLECAHCR